MITKNTKLIEDLVINVNIHILCFVILMKNDIENICVGNICIIMWESRIVKVIEGLRCLE